MKKFILLFLMMYAISSIQAAPVFFSWGEETIEKVADFPDTEEFKNIEGKFVDAGFRYKQVSIFFIPVWNYDMEWCGYISDKFYVDVTKEKLDTYAGSVGVKLPKTYELSFWNRMGGKLTLGGIILLYVLYKSRSSKKEDSPATS